MVTDQERRLARIEGKINIIARSVGFVFALGAGFGTYFAFRDNEWAVALGFAAGALASALYVELPIRSLEKRLADQDDE